MQSTCTGTAHNFSGKFTQHLIQVKTFLAPARKLATGYLAPKNFEKKYKKSLCLRIFDLSSYSKHI